MALLVELIRRIKCFLPRDIRERLVKSTIMPFPEYADVTWGDKANVTLMKKVQVLQNLATKIISICRSIPLLPRRSIILAVIT